MDWGDIGTLAVQVLGGAAILSGIAVSLASFTREQRIRRRLKSDTEVMQALDGDQKQMMRKVIDLDVERLHQHTIKSTTEEPSGLRAFPAIFGSSLLAVVLGAFSYVAGETNEESLAKVLGTAIMLIGFLMLFVVSLSGFAYAVEKSREKRTRR